jgi:hypothetical protein
MPRLDGGIEPLDFGMRAEVNGSAFPAVPLGQVIQYRIELVARHGHDRSVHRPCR